MKHNCKITPDNIQGLKENEIFVFGSNLKGAHGGGAALLAKNKFGAKLGIGVGRTGNCYAFPTKDYNIETLPIFKENETCIHQFIEPLLEYIKLKPELHFYITEVGCGLAGYSAKDIAPLFKGFEELNNVSLPKVFLDIITKPLVIKTFKMTDKNMKCRDFQFEIGKKYIHEGKVLICNSGFHSCQTAQNCLDYYSNDGDNRLFLCEVEINDRISFEDGDNLESFKKIATDNITFIEELTDSASIYWNSGDWNSGNRNSGDWNSGNGNSGYWNSGNENSGNGNSGNRNSGDRNSGNWNSGNGNSGYWNSGNRNSGNGNSGNWNSGNGRNRILCSKETPLYIFNKISDKKEHEIYYPSWMYFDLIVWKYEYSMSEDEKLKYPYYKTIGGCLIIKDYKQAAIESYNKATKEEQRSIEDLPNYDAQILFEIFGIDRR